MIIEIFNNICGYNVETKICLFDFLDLIQFLECLKEWE